ncbi:ABC transporter substrate-binding protein [Beijerinckia sp. L45]|uniref:ABC transporter substrate-binding protein n=1 Tax=Beijerinckia sp. L45 TaxID=1641855 RepID=UPI00131D48F8|nr:ABC transporter substrate-binding protein [Beijerinckia sp. L45]
MTEVNRLPLRRVFVGIATCVALLAGTGASPAQEGVAPTPVKILYLSRADDVAYADIQAADGVFRPPLPSPFAGAELAVKDTRATAHALGITIDLDHTTLESDGPIAAEAQRIVADAPAAVIADLPEADMVALVKALPASSVPIFNIRHRADSLRQDLCGSAVYHVIPSRSMLTDALAQFAVQKNWRKVLVLRGPAPDDIALANAFETSAQKFGARIVDTKAFVLGHDPRKRAQTNITLLTGSDDYDVLFLADTGGDFGRYVPYQLARPRPVIGTEGLRATAWDSLSDRFGAPQVNHRFERSAHRSMTEYDWAAWVAVRAVVEAARHKALTGPAVAAALAHDAITMDVSKGMEASFRPWDHQFRQSIVLQTSDVVIEMAPLEGFLHRVTPLDTLGTDAPEFSCKAAVR